MPNEVGLPIGIPEPKLEEWMPMPPEMGPPLPRLLGIYWPWYKPPVAPPVYACPYCGAEFSTEAELLEHIRTEHPEQPPAPPLEARISDAAFEVTYNAAGVLAKVTVTIDSPRAFSGSLTVLQPNISKMELYTPEEYQAYLDHMQQELDACNRFTGREYDVCINHWTKNIEWTQRFPRRDSCYEMYWHPDAWSYLSTRANLLERKVSEKRHTIGVPEGISTLQFCYYIAPISAEAIDYDWTIQIIPKYEAGCNIYSPTLRLAGDGFSHEINYPEAIRFEVVKTGVYNWDLGIVPC